jgi:hypothetical protein
MVSIHEAPRFVTFLCLSVFVVNVLVTTAIAMGRGRLRRGWKWIHHKDTKDSPSDAAAEGRLSSGAGAGGVSRLGEMLAELDGCRGGGVGMGWPLVPLGELCSLPYSTRVATKPGPREPRRRHDIAGSALMAVYPNRIYHRCHHGHLNRLHQPLQPGGPPAQGRRLPAQGARSWDPCRGRYKSGRPGWKRWVISS